MAQEIRPEHIPHVPKAPGQFGTQQAPPLRHLNAMDASTMRLVCQGSPEHWAPLSHADVTRHSPSRGRLQALDAYFRRQDTCLARSLHTVSPSAGAAYGASKTKRIVDLAVSVPAAVIVILLIVLLAAINKVLHPRDPALFFQERVGHNAGTLRIVKLRSMMIQPPLNPPEGICPRCTRFGRFLRRYYLDELPQLLQVLTGQLSLVGIRVLPTDIYDGLAASWSRERFASWQATYASTALGLTGVHQVSRQAGKEDERRYYRDMFYARHASLGFDLYLMWRTLSTRNVEHTQTITVLKGGKPDHIRSLRISPGHRLSVRGGHHASERNAERQVGA